MSDTNTTVVSTNVVPTVNIIAAGGGGINMARLAFNDIKGRASLVRLDTSNANLQPGEKALVLGGGGSGLVRSQNAETVRKAIAGISDEALGLADVNIVLFSLSGGSGSVIGPLLIGDIASRRKRLVIALTIASSQSEIHTSNTLRTLQSLRKIADTNKIYLPITIFNNNIGGQAAVDTAFPYKLARLVELLVAPTVEIDKNDRLHWINVPKTLGADITGLRLLYVTATPPGTREFSNTEVRPDDNGHIYDSLIAIGTDQYPVENKPRARVTFEGKFVTIQLVPIYGVIGNPANAFDSLVKTINETLTDFQTNAAQHDDPFSSDGGSSSGGLIF